MGVDRLLVLKLALDTGDLNAKLGGVEGTLAGIGTKVKSWGIALAADLAISLGQGLADGISGGIDAAKEAEAIGAQLENTWSNLDLGTLEELDAITADLGKRALSLGFDDDSSLAQFREFLTLTKDVDEATKLMSATWDLARASGDDMGASGDKVRNMFLGMSRTLNEFGAGAEGLKGMEAVEAAMLGMSGAADEHMTETEGRMERFQGRIDEIFEAIGAVVLKLTTPFLDLMDAIDPVLEGIADGIGPAFDDMGTVLGPVLESVGDLITKMVDLWDALDSVRALIVDLLSPAFENMGILVATTFGNAMAILDAFTKLLNGDVGGAVEDIKKVFKDSFDAIASVVKNSLNAVIKLWNLLDFSIDIEIHEGFEVLGQKIGVDFEFHSGDIIPDIPLLAKGGIVTGPTLAMIGEGGHPEAVIPLDGRHGMGDTYHITVQATASSPADVGRAVVEAIEAYERRAGRGWRN